MSFHLFRLPESIYIDIINTMNPCEQFFTSLSSRKAYSIIKMNRHQIEYAGLYTKGNFEVHLDNYETTFIEFHQSSKIPNPDLEKVLIDGSLVKYELKEDNVVTTYWEEPIVGTMKLIEYVCDLFNVEVRDMGVHCDSGDRLMKWVQQFQTILERVRFISRQCEEKFTPETLKNLIMGCEAKTIFFNAYTTEPLRLSNFQKKCTYLGIAIGTWFTLENLMTFDCIEVWITERHFTSTEMNRFFKHWMSGGSPRLSLLRVKLDNYKEQELMDGIDVKWNMKTVYARTSDECAFLKFDGFHEIQKTTNGMSAGFKFEDGLLYFGVWPCCFNLFRLPHVAFMIIINAMNTTEQFMTSLCSRKSFSIIKTYRRRSEDITMATSDKQIVITGGEEQLISYQLDPLADGSTPSEMVTINGHSTPSYYERDIFTIDTYWAEPLLGTKELVEHVCGLFGIQVDTVTINSNSGTRFMNWVQRRQRSIRMMKVLSFNEMEDKFESEDLKNIIMECKADSIQLNALHSSPFEIQNLNKKFNVFECLSGTWITVDNLITLDCIRITIEERWFTCAEMNRFIKHWINGGSVRLRMLLVPLSEYNDDALLEGLDVRWATEKMVVVSCRGTEYQITIFCEVERNDGMTAGFVVDTQTGLFWFGVWPSDTGDFIDMRSY
uniref:F-box domain-containing protein n=1 Tax=Caenorhabditis tropicalis TaxID=1561998 RepID=A0A1I7UN09_9PELO